ncbi:MAG: phosphopyruvate hydratase [Pseudomonadota bacterium]|nr:phosphopyruvate hydratase [Pseudomonadota bacterium]
MKGKFVVKELLASEIMDSRGLPTVACQVRLQDGASGFMQVPSGQSTGQYEACELRDLDPDRYFGKGVRKAVSNIENIIAPLVCGRQFESIEVFDSVMLNHDNTSQKTFLGANAILAVSGAFARAAAFSSGLPLYAFFSRDAHVLPVPLMNVINGGKHAHNPLVVQEFMLVPHGFDSFSAAIFASGKITKVLGDILSKQCRHVGRGDEGGYAPDFSDTRSALDAICMAIKQAGFSFDQVSLALDMAASEYCNQSGYFLDKEGQVVLPKEAWLDYLESLVSDYPIVSIEDAADETDFDMWKLMTERLSSRVQLVGDDVFVTQIKRLKLGMSSGVANAILIKPNQVGSVSETIATMDCAYANGYKTVVSHRSGETEDSIISDISVGYSAGQIKAGPLRQSDRVAKYNRLLWIERELGNRAKFAKDIYKCYLDARLKV